MGVSNRAVWQRIIWLRRISRRVQLESAKGVLGGVSGGIGAVSEAGRGDGAGKHR